MEKLGKLVLGCEDEILNSTEASIKDKKVITVFIYFFGNDMLVIISFRFC